MTATAKLLPLIDVLPALILLGRDDSNKPHASWFTADELDGAMNAAKLMGMMTLNVSSAELRQLVDRLPHGKLFGSGKAFVPFVRGDLYDQLIGHVPLAEQVRPLKLVRAQAEGSETKPADSNVQKTEKPAFSLPTDWTGIVAGSVVLAQESPEEGWWEAVVLKSEAAGKLELRWRDFDAPFFTRPLKEIALMHTSRSPEA